MPLRSCSLLPVVATSSVSSLFAALIFLSMTDEFGDQLGGEPAAGAPDQVHAAGRVFEQGAGLRGGQELLRPAGHQFQQQLVDAVERSVRARPSPSRRSTSSRNATVASSAVTCRKPLLRNADHGDAVGVDRVGLAALAGGEHPRPGGQLRRHVHHGLAVGDQALSDVPADAVAALHRPDPLRVPAAELRASPGSRRVSVPNRPCARTFSRSSMISIVADRLCGSIPMMTRPTLVLLDSDRGDIGEEGNATSSWADPS